MEDAPSARNLGLPQPSGAPENVTVDESNQEQLDAWEGRSGHYWAANALWFDRAIGAYNGDLFAAARIRPLDDELDVGCGAGSTTRHAAKLALQGKAVGIDLSTPMLTLARQAAVNEGVTNVEFIHGDAQVFPFDDARFDLALSRTGAMFFGDSLAAFKNIHRSLRCGGRLALLTWQAFRENEWMRCITRAMSGDAEPEAPPPDAPGMFALSDPARVTAVLTSAGFSKIQLRAVAQPMNYGASVEQAAAFIFGLAEWMLEDGDERQRSLAMEGLTREVLDHQTRDGIQFGSAAWVIMASKE
jgi:SAM-dependent methyltransferase